MRRAAVLGHPILHSLSPVLHRAAYEELGLDWEYSAIDVDQSQLADFVATCDSQWAGLSLTMPLKHAVLELLDIVEPLADVVGAVNTVLFQPSGSKPMLVGANTDVYGIVAAMREGQTQLSGPASAAPSGVVLGAGATASSALAALGELGCHTPAVFVRSLARTGALRRAATRMGIEPSFHLLDRAPEAMATADIVVSTTPAGAADALTAEVTTACGVLLDVVYDPRPTALGAAWTAAGGVNVPGERMLLHQAGEQVRLMTGLPAPVSEMAAALESALTG